MIFSKGRLKGTIAFSAVHIMTSISNSIQFKYPYHSLLNITYVFIWGSFGALLVHQPGAAGRKTDSESEPYKRCAVKLKLWAKRDFCCGCDVISINFLKIFLSFLWRTRWFLRNKWLFKWSFMPLRCRKSSLRMLVCRKGLQKRFFYMENKTLCSSSTRLTTEKAETLKKTDVNTSFQHCLSTMSILTTMSQIRHGTTSWSVSLRRWKQDSD